MFSSSKQNVKNQRRGLHVCSVKESEFYVKFSFRISFNIEKSIISSRFTCDRKVYFLLDKRERASESEAVSANRFIEQHYIFQLNWSVKQRSIPDDAKYTVNLLKTVHRQNSGEKQYTYVSNLTFRCVYPTVLGCFILSLRIKNTKLIFFSVMEILTDIVLLVYFCTYNP